MTFLTPRVLAFLIVVVVVVFPCLLAINAGTLIFLFGALLIPLFALFSARPDLLVVLICWMYYSSIRLPGVSGGRLLYELLMVAFAAVALITRIVSRRPRTPSWGRTSAFFFLVILFVTLSIRGAGFQTLGGNMWGGGRYLGMIPCILFFLASDQIELSPRKWRIAVIGMMLMSLVPGVCELLYSIVGRPMIWQYYVFRPSPTAIQMPEMGEDLGSVRFAGFLPGTFIFLLPFFLYPRRGPHLFLYAGILLLSLTMIGMTGHRLNLVILALYLWFYFGFKTKHRFRYLVGSAVIMAAVMALLAFVAQFLPHNFQRPLAIIPYASVSHNVYVDAQGTSRWRIMVWKEALKDIPQYLWLGKGYAYDASAFISAMRNSSKSEYSNILWALLSGSYHQGILSLLLGLGLPGLVTGLGFLVAILFRHFRFTTTPWPDAGLQRIHYVFFVMAFAMSLTYVAIYGDAFANLPDIFFYAALLEGVRRSQEQETLRAQEAPAEPAPPASSAHRWLNSLQAG